MRLPRALDADLHVVAERGQEIHQAFHREISRPIAHEQRHVRLLDAENLTGLRLRQMACLDDAVDLQRQAGFEQFLFGMGRPKSAKTFPLLFT